MELSNILDKTEEKVDTMPFPEKKNRIYFKWNNGKMKSLIHCKHRLRGTIYTGSFSDFEDKSSFHDFNICKKIVELQNHLIKYGYAPFREYAISYFSSNKRYLMIWSDYRDDKYTLLYVTKTPYSYSNRIYMNGKDITIISLDYEFFLKDSDDTYEMNI